MVDKKDIISGRAGKAVFDQETGDVGVQLQGSNTVISDLKSIGVKYVNDFAYKAVKGFFRGIGNFLDYLTASLFGSGRYPVDETIAQPGYSNLQLAPVLVSNRIKSGYSGNSYRTLKRYGW
jgi:hypothetical protein